MSDSNFPFRIFPVDGQTNKQLLKDFKGERTKFVQVSEKKYFFPNKFAEDAHKYYNMEVRSDDVWIVSFPRSGTTLTQELIWLIANDLNYKKAATVPLTDRFPFLEFGAFVHDEIKKEILKDNSHSELNQQLVNHCCKSGWEFFPKMKSPRFIKTHLPFSLLPKEWHNKKCKTIYVARNPKDVIISFYHLNKLFRTQGYQGNLEKYWYYFKHNLQPWTPYWSHLQEGWTRRFDSNVLFLFYEDLLMDMAKCITKIAAFLDKTLTDQQIDKLINHLSFDNFKKNDAVNSKFLSDLKITENRHGFVRQGKISNIDNECSSQLEDSINNWINDNLKNVDIKFPKIN